MKIGSAWTRTSKEDNKTFISVMLDETILELFPQLKKCNISASYISPENRKSEKSPGWYVNLSVKKEANTSNDAAASTLQSNENTSDEDISF